MASLKSKLAAAKKVQNQDTAPHLIVQALAGTGKTTTIIEALKLLKGQPSTLTPSPQQKAIWDCIYLSAEHAKSVCFVAFNKSIAAELQRRVPPGVDAMTMHAMGLRAITATYGKVAVVGHRVDDIIIRILPQFHDIWDLRRKRPGLIPLTKQLVDLCKMNLLDGTEEDCYALLDHHAMDPGEDATVPEAVELVPHVLEACADVEADRTIDFSDMIWIPIKNNLTVKQYDLLFWDEVQDGNRCQQALAKKAGHRLVLVGDSHQAIYGFAGADSASMKRMELELSGMTNDPKDGRCCLVPTEPKCVVLPLTVTRRCGKAIVEEARKYVPSFEAHESNPPGIISRRGLDDKSPFCDQTTGSTVNKTTYHSYCQDGDMVLCRMNAPLVSECFKFLKAGRRANIQGRDIGQGLISTVKATKAESVTDLVHALGKWVSDQTAKEQAKKHPSVDKITAIEDRYDCIMAFVDGQSSVAGVLNRIEEIFTDSKDSPGIKLSSIHKSKGLESSRVFILETEKTRKILGIAKDRGGWQYEQEQNLIYVAITRAISEFVYVS